MGPVGRGCWIFLFKLILFPYCFLKSQGRRKRFLAIIALTVFTDPNPAAFFFPGSSWGGIVQIKEHKKILDLGISFGIPGAPGAPPCTALWDKWQRQCHPGVPGDAEHPGGCKGVGGCGSAQCSDRGWWVQEPAGGMWGEASPARRAHRLSTSAGEEEEGAMVGQQERDGCHGGCRSLPGSTAGPRGWLLRAGAAPWKSAEGCGHQPGKDQSLYQRVCVGGLIFVCRSQMVKEESDIIVRAGAMRGEGERKSRGEARPEEHDPAPPAPQRGHAAPGRAGASAPLPQGPSRAPRGHAPALGHPSSLAWRPRETEPREMLMLEKFRGQKWWAVKFMVLSSVH